MTVAASFFDTYGIVLRSYLPLKYTCLIFDRMHGVIKAIIPAYGKFSPAQNVTHGALIKYRCVHRHGRYFLEDISIHHVPAPWVSEDIVFLHHILELVSIFLMENSPDQSVLDLLLELYRPQPVHIDEALWKTVFLGRLFMLMGIYPENETNESVGKVLRLISLLGDTRLRDIELGNMNITSEQSDHWRMVLTQWLKKSLARHPDENVFKTAYFLR